MTPDQHQSRANPTPPFGDGAPPDDGVPPFIDPLGGRDPANHWLPLGVLATLAAAVLALLAVLLGEARAQTTDDVDNNAVGLLVEDLELRRVEAAACIGRRVERPLADQLNDVFDPDAAGLPFLATCTALTKLRVNDPLLPSHDASAPTPNRLDAERHRLALVWSAPAADDPTPTGHPVLDAYLDDPRREFPVFVALVLEPRFGHALQWLALDSCSVEFSPDACAAVDLRTGDPHPLSTDAFDGVVFVETY